MKRGFVVLQRMLTTGRSHIAGEKAEEAADGAKALGFPALAKAIQKLAEENEEGAGDDKKKDKKVCREDSVYMPAVYCALQIFQPCSILKNVYVKQG